ncbi:MULTISPECIES: hypothetical protein [Heyndrickxia]|uniref:hypothetical protein n=1 Tax=Heyndrickxia TaxID=2837504 RepID=UPI0003A9988E|nr:hypothetical protein [Heyndrickxia oleronia]GIN39750.1 hypothetical protein J19TS1_26990 [Heyndrickxia oleronia]
MFQIYDVALIPLIAGLVELAKRAGLPIKYSPYVAIILGLLLSFFYLTDNIKEGIIVGLMLGLSASGLYSSSKNIAKNSNGK